MRTLFFLIFILCTFLYAVIDFMIPYFLEKFAYFGYILVYNLNF